MKNFALIFSMLSFAVQAETVIVGGFGTDGATGESIPLARSVKDASEVFNALNVKENSDNKKVIALSDESEFSCVRPTRGISRVNAGCDISLRASQKGVLVRGAGLSGKVTFTGPLATKIFSSLPIMANYPIGASTRSVANVSCSKVVRPGVEASCTITDTNAIALDVEL